jgi:hypothetical protein
MGVQVAFYIMLLAIVAVGIGTVALNIHIRNLQKRIVVLEKHVWVLISDKMEHKYIGEEVKVMEDVNTVVHNDRPAWSAWEDDGGYTTGLGV